MNIRPPRYPALFRRTGDLQEMARVAAHSRSGFGRPLAPELTQEKITYRRERTRAPGSDLSAGSLLLAAFP